MFVYCDCCALSVEVSASGWSLVQGSPAECVHACTIECHCEALIMRRPWPTRRCYAMGGKNIEKCLNYCQQLAHTFLCVPSHWMDCSEVGFYFYLHLRKVWDTKFLWYTLGQFIRLQKNEGTLELGMDAVKNKWVQHKQSWLDHICRLKDSKDTHWLLTAVWVG